MTHTKRYRVTGTYSGTITIVVEAKSVKDAERVFCESAWKQHGVALVDDVIHIEVLGAKHEPERD